MFNVEKYYFNSLWRLFLQITFVSVNTRDHHASSILIAVFQRKKGLVLHLLEALIVDVCSYKCSSTGHAVRLNRIELSLVFTIVPYRHAWILIEINSGIANLDDLMEICKCLMLVHLGHSKFLDEQLFNLFKLLNLKFNKKIIIKLTFSLTWFILLCLSSYKS